MLHHECSLAQAHHLGEIRRRFFQNYGVFWRVFTKGAVDTAASPGDPAH
jgi:hypothetical protein